MDTLITVLFGPPGAAMGWVSEEEIPHLPPVGIPVRIRVHSDEGEETIEGQVFRSWEEDESDPGGLLIYGGVHIPDVSIREILEGAGWEALSEDAAALLAGTIHESPVIAARHEVNFFVGDGDTVELYRQVIQPTSPILPLFGQRMRMNFVEADMESGLSFLDETAWDISDISPLLEQDDDDEPEEISDDDWRRMQEEDRELVDKDITSGCPGDVENEGLPLIVLYSSLVEPGLARLGFWTSSLGSLTELDLLAVGWEKIEIPTRFDPAEFNLRRRIELALATHVVFESNNYDSIRVRDWWLDVPGLVSEEDREYLPPFLYQWALGAQQVDDIDELVKQWAQSAES